MFDCQFSFSLNRNDKWIHFALPTIGLDSMLKIHLLMLILQWTAGMVQTVYPSSRMDIHLFPESNLLKLCVQSRTMHLLHLSKFCGWLFFSNGGLWNLNHFFSSSDTMLKQKAVHCFVKRAEYIGVKLILTCFLQWTRLQIPLRFVFASLQCKKKVNK